MEYSKSFDVVPNLSIGSVISLTSATLKSKPLFFFGLPFIAFLPLGFMFISQPFVFYFKPGYFVLMSAGSFFLTMIGQGAVAHGVFQSLRDEPVAAGASLWRGLSRLLSMILILIMLGFVVMGFSYVVIFGLYLVREWGTVANLIYVLLCLALALALLCRVAVTIQACVVEKAGALKSLNRSTELSRGNRLKILLLLLIVFVLGAVLGLIGSGLTSVLTRNPGIILFTTLLLRTLVSGFTWAMLAVLYFELRRVNEGLSVNKLAEVFD